MIEFGWAKWPKGTPCVVHPTDPGRMLCGRQLRHVDVTFTGPPDDLHDVCRQLLADMPAPVGAEVAEGTCPTCGNPVPVVDGVVGAHSVWAWVSGRRKCTGRDCPGVGSEPEVEG